jgi:hypothetical protein
MPERQQLKALRTAVLAGIGTVAASLSGRG